MNRAMTKKKLVYFRITDQQFGAMQDLCQKGMARTVSDLARFAVQRTLLDPDADALQSNGSSLLERMRAVNDTLAAMQKQLQTMDKTLQSLLVSRQHATTPAAAAPTDITAEEA